MSDKQEWLLKIKEWLSSDTDDGVSDVNYLDLSKSGLTYHEVWKACEESGYKQDDLELDENDKVDTVTFAKKPNEIFELALEYDEELTLLQLSKYYF